MKPENNLITVYFIFFILLAGCTKTELEHIDPEQYAFSQPQGREIRDPYEIHNIRQAYSNLKISGKIIPSSDDIEPTHLYIRFLPKNEEESDLLKKDSSLVLYDHPLNCEKEENMAHQDFVTDSACVCQYCVVPEGQKLPAVRHELIYEVFIPPDESTNKSLSPEMIRFYGDLESESARITGNLEDEGKPENDARGSSSKWTPQGTIRVWDDLLGIFIPLQYANVHARWFTHVETCLTDENGYFRMKPFRHKVNYSIKWENSLYTIRNGMFLQAWYNGPKMKGDWNLDIRGGKSIMFATIHRAAYKSFYGDNLNIYRPILINGGRTKICYIDDEGKGEFWGDWSSSGIIPDIRIWGKTNGGYKPTNKIFGSTVHELGHQSHSLYLGNIKYWSISKVIRESWADAVEWALSNDEYHKLGFKYGIPNAIGYNHYYNTHNRWPYVKDRDYSPIFIDLMDQLNQRTLIGPGYPNDLISGYSISYLNYTFLRNTKDINSLRDQVNQHKADKVDDFEIGELFELYKELNVD